MAMSGAVLTVAATAVALGFQEGQEVGVNGIGLGRRHAVRKALVGFQCAILQQLRRQGCRIGIRHDRSSSPCITRTGTVIFFRSSVKSVWEKATMPSLCALASFPTDPATT